MSKLYEALTSNENKDLLVEHIKDEVKYDKKRQEAMIGEWASDYAVNNEPFTDIERVVDVLVENSTPYDVGEKYKIDWTGFAESMGLE